MTGKTPLYVFGAGGHGKVVAEAAHATQRVLGFLDDDHRLWGREWDGLRVLGGLDALLLLEEEAEVALGVGENGIRADLGRALLARGRHLATIVHSDGRGDARSAGSATAPSWAPWPSFTPAPRSGAACIVNTAAVVEHDCASATGFTSRRGPPWEAACASGEGAHLGLGAVVLPGLSVGAWATLGAGAVLTHALPGGAVAVGVPARCARRPGEDRMNGSPSRIYLSPPHMGEEERHLLMEAFDSNWIAPLGPHVDAFEAEFATAVGARHAAALSSGTAALHLALRLAWTSPAATRSTAPPSPSWPARTRSSTRGPRRCSSTRTRLPGTWIRRCSARRSTRPRAGAACRAP